MLIKIDPKKPETIIHDRIGSMIDKVRRTGTSQDDNEKVEYLDQSQYKGYTCLIAKTPFYFGSYVEGRTLVIRYKGIATETYTNGLINNNLETMFCKDKREAGKELYRLIDIHRKQFNGQNK